ncbi:CHASE3 domain-containing protein [Microlunatus panaciterrae]|uniref:CHASE3 domain-containing protein n=1 Tax=Microlunatus panaciterrae TaxID=400768 RepID=UPI00195DECA6
MVVGAVVGVLLANALVANQQLRRSLEAQEHLRGRIRPAQQDAARLAMAYIDQESGQRGFLLTGDDSFLEPYETGRARAATLQAALSMLLQTEPVALAQLDKVIASAELWSSGVAEPSIAQRKRGPVAPRELARQAMREKALFDDLRTQLETLEAEITAIVVAQIRVVTAANSAAAAMSLLSGGIAVAAAAIALLLWYGLLERPLRDLLRQLNAFSVAGHDEPIIAKGPREIASIGAAIEGMRSALLARNAELLEAQRQLSVHDERDRFAADLHDLVIQRIFAIGLALSSLTVRRPEMTGQIQPLIDETDQVIRELRAVIFAITRGDLSDLREGATRLVRDSARSLGFVPELEIEGDVAVAEEVAAEALAVLREALSNVARHAHADRVVVKISGVSGQLQLTVTDNGIGLSPGAQRSGLLNMVARAEHLGGAAEFGPGADGGTAVSWVVPARPIFPGPVTKASPR